MSKSSDIVFPANVTFRPEAVRDWAAFDRVQKTEIAKAITKVAANPAPKTEGGYGKPLSGKLSGCMKIKLRASGIRIIYEFIRSSNGMDILVIAMRADDEVYALAQKRKKQQ